MGVAMVGVAIAGLAVSSGIPPDAGRVATEDKFRWNPLGEVAIGTRHLLRDRPDVADGRWQAAGYFWTCWERRFNSNLFF